MTEKTLRYYYEDGFHVVLRDVTHYLPTERADFVITSDGRFTEVRPGWRAREMIGWPLVRLPEA